MRIQSGERQLHERLTAALYRLTSLEQAASDANGSKYERKLLEGMRRAISEFEVLLADLQRAAARAVQLQDAAELAAGRAQLLFDLTPSPCLVVDASGTITDANPAAIKLLNVSRRHLTGRPFHLFLARDRELFLQKLGEVGQAAEVETWPIVIRPRERSAVPMTVSVVAEPSCGAIVMLLPPGAPTDAMGAGDDAPEPDAAPGTTAA